MKTGVFLINTARGSIVNEKDVAEAMKEGKIRGFGTDVFEKNQLIFQRNYFNLKIILLHLMYQQRLTKIVKQHRL